MRSSFRSRCTWQGRLATRGTIRPRTQTRRSATVGGTTPVLQADPPCPRSPAREIGNAPDGHDEDEESSKPARVDAERKLRRLHAAIGEDVHCLEAFDG